VSESAIHSLLRQTFPISNKTDWLRTAAAEIDGKDPAQILAWKLDDLTFSPYYDRADVASRQYLENFELSPSPHAHTGARFWENLPQLVVTDEKKDNATLLHHLNNGADGIILDVRNRQTVDIAALLNQVEWPYCNVSFSVTHDILENVLSAYVREKKYEPHSLSGTIWWNDLPKKNIPKLSSLAHLTHFRRWGIVADAASPVTEIANVLTKTAQVMDALTEEGVEKEMAWRNLALSVPADTDFFCSIAKLKALRLLWFQLAHAFGIPLTENMALQLHVRSMPWIDEKFQPHGNLLKATTAAMAAVMGGCDALTIHAEDANNNTMMRIARNVSSILREESHLDKVADPLAGTYALQEMTHTMAEAAWALLQQNLQQP
jgi:methylmalonyl-CoA mutase